MREGEGEGRESIPKLFSRQRPWSTAEEQDTLLMPFSPLLLRLRDSDPEMLLRQQHRVVISSSPTIMASKQLLKSTPLTLPLRLNLYSPVTISAFPLKSTSRIFPVSLKTSASPYTSHSNVPRPGLSSLFIYMYVRARLVLFFGIAYEH